MDGLGRARFGAHFEPTPLLVEMARKGRRFLQLSERLSRNDDVTSRECRI
jgi:hypothetical protein